MNKILNEIQLLIYEVSVKKSASKGALFTAEVVNTPIAELIFKLIRIYITSSVAASLSSSILGFLVVCVIIHKLLDKSISVIENVAFIIDIDDFILENFERLKLNGYNNIEIVSKKALDARDTSLNQCIKESEKEISLNDKLKFKIIEIKCALPALKTYMRVCLAELYLYYVKLLRDKGIDCSKATSLEYILSHQEEAPFNLVLTKITNRFVFILEFLQQDTNEFKSEVLNLITRQIKSLPPIINKPPISKSFQDNRPQFNRTTQNTAPGFKRPNFNRS